ncbi:MAG: hypothetical protein V4488_19590 [Pseudomonadota bacterium]
MIKYLVLLTILFTCLSTFAYADQNCLTKKTSEIVKVFDKGIVLNEKFKKSVGENDKEEYQRLRKGGEQYSEETVIPCVQRAAQLLSKHSNPRLMHKLMELVISYENSADEMISYSMGKVFAANPAAIENAIKTFPEPDRKLISNSVWAGWVNVKPELPSKLVKNRDKRIKFILPSVDSP